MDVTEQARRSDALHYDAISRRELCNMVARVEAENAKLRKYAKLMHDHIKESCDMCDEYYCSNFDEDNECCIYDTLAREVGIEVDEIE